jgi:hypothetical protein
MHLASTQGSEHRSECHFDACGNHSASYGRRVVGGGSAAYEYMSEVTETVAQE